MAAAALAATIGVRAAQAPQGGGRGGLVPMTASTILRDPAPHIGTNVSMMATVETVLSKTVFTVDQDKAKASPQDLLVIAPTLTATPEANAYLTVQGEVMRFDPAEIAKRAKGYTLDLPADAIEKYRGKPVVLATAVVTTMLVDLAKKPIPPMTAGEQIVAAQMKAIQTASGAVRAGLEAPNPAQLKEHVETLKKAFTQADPVFKGLNLADAVGWTADALKLVGTMEAGVAAGKWEGLKAASGSLQQLCTACHTARRDRMDDGSYRIRIGG